MNGRQLDAKYNLWISVFVFHFKNILISHKRGKNWQESLKKQAYNTHAERKKLEKNSDDLFAFDFFGFGENIWKILSAPYVVDQLRRFGKRKLKQDTGWDVWKVTKASVTKHLVRKSTQCFLFQVKNLNS